MISPGKRSWTLGNPDVQLTFLDIDGRYLLAVLHDPAS